MHYRILLGLSIEELAALCDEVDYGLEEALKLAHYIYKKGVRRFDEMENLPKNLRQYLADNTTIGISPYSKVETAANGTKKYLFATTSGNYAEAIYEPSEKRNSLFISTQIGCQMGCRLCTTTKAGFWENLLPHEILNQLTSIDERSSVNRIVIKGMGERVDSPSNVEKCLEILNEKWGFSFGATNITFSTIGIASQLQSIIEKKRCNISICLHSPFPEERTTLIPAESQYPIVETLTLLRSLPIANPLRLSFEYTLLEGVNTSPAHAATIAGILNGVSCHVNLIPYNPRETSPYNAPSLDDTKQFEMLLNLLGIGTTIRKSTGNDINAACGQLSAT